ncbi:MAG: hypothetical protein WAU06_00665, partial [Candidatus Nanopelagicales bacterium]
AASSASGGEETLDVCGLLLVHSEPCPRAATFTGRHSGVGEHLAVVAECWMYRYIDVYLYTVSAAETMPGQDESSTQRVGQTHVDERASSTEGTADAP